LLALVTLGHAYLITLALMLFFGVTIVVGFGRPGRHWYGVLLLTVGYAALMFNPLPRWLPPVSEQEPRFFYLHWAGFAYLYLKSLHVLLDQAAGRLPPPVISDLLAYLAFAPTLRMGPIYRFQEFASQLRDPVSRHRSFGVAGIRLVTGLLRLGIMMVLLQEFSPDTLFRRPESLSTARLIASIYCAPISFYLWFSGYVDLSIAVGRVVGFTVPENFNYPWRASSIAEFWQRWHITLRAWLIDYIFTPLVRRRVHYFYSFTLTFLFAGLWHGPELRSVIWGASQGIGLAVRRAWMQRWRAERNRNSPLYQTLLRYHLVQSPVPVILGWLITFHYEVVTITISMDEDHIGARLIAYLVSAR
jgi:D-alanyl-lipoteichoic acid acyltransferase DltB (MBOAT superfamily)